VEAAIQHQRILDLVAREPGLHLRELPRRLDLSLNAVRYHLYSLLGDGLVVEHRIGRFVRYFRPSTPREERALISAVRVPGERLVLHRLLSSPAGFAALQRSTSLPPGTLSHYLTLLIREAIVDQDAATRLYRLHDTAAVRSRLAQYRERFPDLLAAAAEEMFDLTG